MGTSRYTHGHAESVLRSHRWRTAENSCGYLLPHLAPGHRLVDVGAGPGTITADLAERVAPGRVTAVEATEEALALSRAELGGRGIDADFVVGDVHALDLPDDTFDVVHAHQVLQHVADPVRALRELRRVCRPGGVVAVRDSDYSAFAWFPRAAGAGPLDGALPGGRPRQRRRARRRPAAAVLGAGPPGSPTSPLQPAPGASPTPTTAPTGAACGPTGSSAPRSPPSWSTTG